MEPSDGDCACYARVHLEPLDQVTLRACAASLGPDRALRLHARVTDSIVALVADVSRTLSVTCGGMSVAPTLISRPDWPAGPPQVLQANAADLSASMVGSLLQDGSRSLRLWFSVLPLDAAALPAVLAHALDVEHLQRQASDDSTSTADGSPTAQDCLADDFSSDPRACLAPPCDVRCRTADRCGSPAPGLCRRLHGVDLADACDVDMPDLGMADSEDAAAAIADGQPRTAFRSAGLFSPFQFAGHGSLDGGKHDPAAEDCAGNQGRCVLRAPDQWLQFEQLLQDVEQGVIAACFGGGCMTSDACLAPASDPWAFKASGRPPRSPSSRHSSPSAAAAALAQCLAEQGAGAQLDAPPADTPEHSFSGMWLRSEPRASDGEASTADSTPRSASAWASGAPDCADGCADDAGGSSFGGFQQIGEVYPSSSEGATPFSAWANQSGGIMVA